MLSKRTSAVQPLVYCRYLRGDHTLKKIPASNTSGIRNVSRSRGLWLAKISFARRQFFLGRYKDIADAAAVVEAAEKLRDEVVDEIDQLQDKAVDVLAVRIAELVEEFHTDKAKVFLKAGITNPQGFMELDENAL